MFWPEKSLSQWQRHKGRDRDRKRERKRERERNRGREKVKGIERRKKGNERHNTVMHITYLPEFLEDLRCSFHGSVWCPRILWHLKNNVHTQMCITIGRICCFLKKNISFNLKICISQSVIQLDLAIIPRLTFHKFRHLRRTSACLVSCKLLRQYIMWCGVVCVHANVRMYVRICMCVHVFMLCMYIYIHCRSMYMYIHVYDTIYTIYISYKIVYNSIFCENFSSK